MSLAVAAQARAVLRCKDHSRLLVALINFVFEARENVKVQFILLQGTLYIK